jgi:hypothetical protein
MRGSDGVELPLNTAALCSQATVSAVELPANEGGAGEAVAFNAPIYGADGCLLATLEFVSSDCDRSDSSAKLLHAPAGGS